MFIFIADNARPCHGQTMDQAALQNLLRECFSQSQAKNPAYSLRAFAKRLDMGLGTISEVLAGKRNLSAKSAQKILDRLSIDPTQRKKIFRGTSFKPSYQISELAADHYFILSEWYYLAILNLVRTGNFKPTASHLSVRLGIPVRTAKQSLERLLRVGLLRFEGKKLVRQQIAIQTTDGIPNQAIRKAHLQTLDLAKKAMEEDPLITFDLSSLTFAFSLEDLKEAKVMIREFQDEFAERFSMRKDATEVYRLATQFFSLTVTGEKK